MAIGAEAVRSTELRRSWGRPVGQERTTRVHLVRGAHMSSAAREHIVHLSAPLAARLVGRYHLSRRRRSHTLQKGGCHSMSHECR